MPWKRAKLLGAVTRLCPLRLEKELALFKACFRLQREASEAAKRFIPLVVENVRGAQAWVGPAKWNYGSFYLWGDVPALMPTTFRGVMKVGVTHRSNGSTNFHQGRYDDGLKLPGNNGPRMWSEREIQRLCDAVKVPSESGRRTDIGNGARFTSRDCGIEAVKGPSGGCETEHQRILREKIAMASDGVKINESGHAWYREGLGRVSSSSSSRKQASAEIARIPFPLARHIARTFKQALEVGV